MIAEAAHEVGLADLTVRAVADRLDVSVAGLYHHIEGKADLLRLAAEHAARRLQVPVDRGQHWALWLREWGRYNRNVFLAERELLSQYLEGAIGAEVIAENTDTILANLVDQGFDPGEALTAYHLVTSCAIGSAVSAIREREATAKGRPTADEYRRIVAERSPDDLPHLRRLIDLDVEVVRQPFDEEITTVLVGIAVRRGESWEPIARRLAETGSRRGSA